MEKRGRLPQVGVPGLVSHRKNRGRDRRRPWTGPGWPSIGWAPGRTLVVVNGALEFRAMSFARKLTRELAKHVTVIDYDRPGAEIRAISQGNQRRSSSPRGPGCG